MHAPLIPRQVLFGNPERATPTISPDGKALAYLAPDQGVLNVWVRTVGQADDRPVTSDRKRGIRSYIWRADGRHVLYIQDQDGDENWRVYQTEVATGETRDLTPFENVQAQILAHDHRHPDLLLVALNLRDPSLHEVYCLDLRNGAHVLDTENPGDVASFAADNNLHVRAAHVITPDGGLEIRVRDGVELPWQVFQRWSAEDAEGGVAAFTPDNRAILLISSVDANAARLLQVELDTGETRVLAEDPQYDVSGILTHPDTHALEAVWFERARKEWVLLEPSLEKDFAALHGLHVGDINVLSRDLADRNWVVAFTSDTSPTAYYLYERPSGQGTFLFTSQPALEQHALSPMQPISFQARDGMTIHGYLTLPEGLPHQDLPLVLNVHGGPWTRDTWGLDPEAQWLANRGYAVLQINYRGSTGYGKKYLHAGDREWAGKMHDDLLDGKAWAVAQGYADPARVCIFGGSYGGYATLVGLAFTPEEFACGVDIVGPSSIVTLIRSIPPYWAPMRALFDQRVGNVDTEEEFLNARSPLFKADAIRRPLLIAQGANDPRVKLPESDQIVAAMRGHGLEVAYLVFPDEGHGFARPENRFKFYAATERFLAEHLGGRAEPPGPEEAWDALVK